MPSLREGEVVAERSRRNAFDAFLVWNRRVHFYLGLYLLFFTWLFAFTGLLLNHPAGSSLSSGRAGFRARPNTHWAP